MAEQQGDKNPVVEQLIAVVEARHGERMDDKDREIVRNGIERNLTNTAALAAYPLVNGDEPGSVFRAYRGE
jgi:plasmid stability protein